MRVSRAGVPCGGPAHEFLLLVLARRLLALVKLPQLTRELSPRLVTPLVRDARALFSHALTEPTLVPAIQRRGWFRGWWELIASRTYVCRKLLYAPHS